MSISEILQEAGIAPNERNPQFNLVHASTSRFGMRHGLDRRIIPILEREYPELFTEEAKRAQVADFIRALIKKFNGVR